MKKRIVWIDILRMIGVFGVILMHVVGNTINTYGNLSKTANYIYVFIGILFQFSVPLFVMISGMMFLGKKDITFKEMFKKYIIKIILIILIIGTCMILMEEVFFNKNISVSLIKRVFIRLITGNIWAHMWYLYLILGLYLITPTLVLITNNIKQQDYKMLLIVLFVITVLLSTLNRIFSINIALNTIGISGYIFYYFYGYYLYKYDISKKYKVLNYILSLFSFIFLIYYVNKYASLSASFSYTTFIPFIFAGSCILLFKNKDIKLKINNLINSIGICGLGIYVLHQFFINIIYKLLKFRYIVYHPYTGLVFYTLMIFIISYIITYLLRKIKIIRKYLL